MTATAINKAKPQEQKELYFYTNLKALMEEYGLNVTELSKKTGVTQATIGSLIRGRLKRIDSVSTGKLAQFFNCTLDDFYVMKWE